MNKEIYTPKQNYKILVRTITYNHAKYITDTLDGVAMQQTNFPFVHFVIDDCSTDGEQEVIKTWLHEHCDMRKAEFIDLELANFILVPHKTNGNLTFAIYLLKRNLWKEPTLKGTLVKPWRDHCEYEALCEGDDYWTHPEKLQKQVDILDNNPDCTLCYHACRNLFEDGFSGVQINYGEDVKETYSMVDILKSYNFQTATVVYRPEILKSEFYATLLKPKFSFGDHLLYMTAVHHGRIIGINEQMSIYRRINSGTSLAIRKSSVKVADTIKYFQILHLFSNEEKRLLLHKIQIQLLDMACPGDIGFATFMKINNKLFDKSPKLACHALTTYLKSKILHLIRR